MSLVVHFDGLCEPRNPLGVSTYGYIVKEAGTVLAAHGAFITEGDGSTNNLSEYTACIRAIAWLWNNNRRDEEVLIRGDSQLVIRQLTGEYAVRSPAILPLYEQAKRGLAGLKSYRLEWVRRELNEEADRLSNLAYDQHVAVHRDCIARQLSPRPKK